MRRWWTRGALVLLGILMGVAAADLLATVFRLVPPAHPKPVPLRYPAHPSLPEDAADRPKPPGVRRIVVLGDSFTVTQGEGIRHEDLFGPYLARRLQAMDPAHRYEAILCARAGWTTVDEVVAYINFCERFRPDWVLLAYVLNDIESDATSPEAITVEDLFYRPRSRFERWLVEYSSLYRWWFLRREWPRLKQAWQDYFRALYESNPRGVQRWRRAMDILAERTRTQGVPVIVVIFPFFDYPLGKDYPFADIHAWVAAEAHRRGFAVVDLWRMTFLGQDSARLQVRPGYDAHPNARAHHMVGETLARLFQAWNLQTVPPAPSGP
jgi:lysophospholipase L1-like esterase